MVKEAGTRQGGGASCLSVSSTCRSFLKARTKLLQPGPLLGQGQGQGQAPCFLQPVPHMPGASSHRHSSLSKHRFVPGPWQQPPSRVQLPHCPAPQQSTLQNDQQELHTV